MKNKKILILLLGSLLLTMGSFFYSPVLASNLDVANYLDEYKRIDDKHRPYQLTGGIQMRARVAKVHLDTPGTPDSYLYNFSEVGKSADNGYILIPENRVEAWIGYYGQTTNSAYTSYVKARLASEKIYLEGRGSQVFYNHATVAATSGGYQGQFYFKSVGSRFEGRVKNTRRYQQNYINTVKISAPTTAKVGERVQFKLQTSDASYYILRHQTWFSQIMKSGRTVRTLINYEPQRTARNQERTLTHTFTEPGRYTITLSVEDASYHNNSRTGRSNYSDSVTITIIGDGETTNPTPNPNPSPSPNPSPQPDPEEPPEPERETVPNPSGEGREPGSTDGRASGNAFWELRRTSDARASDVHAEVTFTKTGHHFATRNERQMMKLGNHSPIQRLGKITSTVNAASVKNQNTQYEYSYDFTNYYYDRYECIDSGEKGCHEWRFVERTPVWSKGQTHRLGGTLTMNHRQHDVIKKESIEEVLQEQLLVGRSDTWINNNRSSQAFYEGFNKMSNHFKSNSTQKTQGTLNIKPDDLEYSVSVPSNQHYQGNYSPFKRGYINGHYYMVDVDPSLQEELSNNVERADLGDYALHLQQATMKDKGIKSSKRTFELDFVTDHMFTTANTSFMVSYPFAYELNRHFLYGEQRPTEQIVFDSVKEKMEDEYERQTEQTYMDEIMYVEKLNAGLDEWEKYQRYFIPVTPKSPLEPHTTYVNNIVLENVGLNDVTWQYGQKFLFEHWMFGSGHDDAWLIEQPDPRIPVDLKDTNRLLIKHEDKFTILDLIYERPKKRIHEFRRMDRDWTDKMKGVIGDWNN